MNRRLLKSVGEVDGTPKSQALRLNSISNNPKRMGAGDVIRQPPFVFGFLQD
jgi:hypothetical protein